MTRNSCQVLAVGRAFGTSEVRFFLGGEACACTNNELSRLEAPPRTHFYHRVPSRTHQEPNSQTVKQIGPNKASLGYGDVLRIA